MLQPTVFNTSEICASLGIQHVVLSPGSRNAPLSISFARNKRVKKWILPDERSAGFVALGIAQKMNQAVVLCCTSGTALLNYAPAIAEAYYREIPLIVLSADRPPELIDQRDGQTIRQYEVLANHVKVSEQLPIVSDEASSQQYISGLVAAIQKSQQLPRGPVHVNIPFAEPFYPTEKQELSFEEFVIPSVETDEVEKNFSGISINNGEKVLLVIGQSDEDQVLNEALGEVSARVPVIKSALSNVVADGIEHVDFFLDDQDELAPDVLITTGLSVLSKKLKNYLRRNKPAKHFHFDPAGVMVDTYGTQPHLIKASLSSYLKQENSLSCTPYLTEWKQHYNACKKAMEDYLNKTEFSEATAFNLVLKSLPTGIDLHLGNSMPVRFADLLGVSEGIRVWCNRGTSGIDGVTSTAMGMSFVSEDLNVLLTGDVSFLYDRNAFFHNHDFQNLRIVVFNNLGGGIFRLIDGPSKLPELEEYFETRHNRTAEYICAENKISYKTARNEKEISEALTGFFDHNNQPGLLEIFTDPIQNEQVFKNLKQYIHEQLNL